jgi:peptidoglycan hydrolase-like protein with peptidoglycan-binding domain
LAMVFLALIAAAETVFIARTLLRQGPEASRDASTGSPAASPLASAIDRPTVAQTGDIQHAGVTPSGSRPAAAAARLIIDSDPAGASVVVDGRYHGATPLTVRDIAEGDHRLVLKRNGREVRQRVHVNAGEATSVVVPLPALSPSSGWVGIVAPLELDVYENGSLVGTSRVPRIMLSAGVHTLRLENQATGFRHEEQVAIRSGQRTELAVQLPQSTIHLNAMPWADVWIDGKAVGQTPIGNVPIVIGPHEVVFRHPELGEKTISTLVKAGVPTRLAVNLTRP